MVLNLKVLFALSRFDILNRKGCLSPETRLDGEECKTFEFFERACGWNFEWLKCMWLGSCLNLHKVFERNYKNRQ